MDRIALRCGDRLGDASAAKATKRSHRETTESTETTTTAPARKPSYQQRRHEILLRSDERQLLEAQLDELRRRVGLPTRQDNAMIETVRLHSADVEEKLHIHNLYLARLHSMTTNELLEPPVNPLSTFIHLPQDMAQRRAILCGILDVKLRRGIECVTQRLHHLDHTQPYLSEERFTTASGEYHYIRQEIQTFANFKTARQLFDTFVNFQYNMEISVTEGLGQMALREDSMDYDPTIWNHRIVTVADDVGCTEELNFVGFARFYDHSPATNSPLGVVVLDIANVDDLYPYQPDERVCKDIQAAHLIYEVRKPGSTETVVVYKLITFVVQLPPQFELAPHALVQLQQNCSRWPDFIVKYLRDFVVPVPDTTAAVGG